MDIRDRFRGCLLGLAIGDAVGTTLEFKSPGSFTPINDMIGGGPFQLKAGEWTDDTSMALCLATSLVERTDSSQGTRWIDNLGRTSRSWPSTYIASRVELLTVLGFPDLCKFFGQEIR